MGGLKIGGKDVLSTAKPAPAPAPRTPRPTIEPPPVGWHDPYTDPFPAPDVSDPALAASWLAETGIWVQQWISDVAAMARKLDRLQHKLADPKLADDPHRPAAIEKARGLDTQLVNRVRDIGWTEAECDRTWQALTPAQRRHADAAAHWMTDPAAVRLIGRAWKGIGAFETWPRHWHVRRAWFSGFPDLLILDMKNAGLWEWKPTPTAPDPFGGESVIDTALARQLEGRGALP